MKVDNCKKKLLKELYLLIFRIKAQQTKPTYMKKGETAQSNKLFSWEIPGNSLLPRITQSVAPAQLNFSVGLQRCSL